MWVRTVLGAGLGRLLLVRPFRVEQRVTKTNHDEFLFAVCCSIGIIRFAEWRDDRARNYGPSYRIGFRSVEGAVGHTTGRGNAASGDAMHRRKVVGSY